MSSVHGVGARASGEPSSERRIGSSARIFSIVVVFVNMILQIAFLSSYPIWSAIIISVLLGIVLAELDVVSVDVGDEGVFELIELALILTLISDGLVVDRELLGRLLDLATKGCADLTATQQAALDAPARSRT